MTPMRLEVTYRFEDYREANASLSSRTTTKKTSAFGIAAGTIVGLLVVFLLILVLVAPRRTSVATPPPVAAAPTLSPVAAILFPLIPWIVIFGSFLFFLLSTLNKPSPNLRGNLGYAKVRGSPFGKFAIGAVVVCVILGMLSLLNTEEGTSPWINFAPWIIIAAVLYFAVRRVGESVVRRGWYGQPHLSREQVIEFHGDTLVQSDSLARHEYSWEALPAFRETQNLLLVHVSDLGFIMIPKRAFADEAQLNACRQILQSKIAIPTQAFPVLPVTPLPLPLPVANAVNAEQRAQ